MQTIEDDSLKSRWTDFYKQLQDRENKVRVNPGLGQLIEDTVKVLVETTASKRLRMRK